MYIYICVTWCVECNGICICGVCAHGSYTCVGSVHGAYIHMCACHTHVYIFV